MIEVTIVSVHVINLSKEMEVKSDSKTLEIIGDLQLSNLDAPATQKETSIHEEVNNFLRDQLFQRTSENEALKKNLQEKDKSVLERQKEIDELSTKLREFEYDEYVSSSKFANSKIVELSRKLRDKTSEYELYKTKCSKLNQNLIELQQKYEDVLKEQERDNKPAVSSPSDVEKMQQKLSQVTSKLFETKNSYTQVKHDLQLANKWLQQETGDNFETLTAINETSNWRGRAQIICDLQQKNHDLKEKLKSYQTDSKNPSPQHQVKHEMSMNSKKIDALNKENFEVKITCEENKRKLDIAKARIKALESECAMLKLKLADSNENEQLQQKKIAELQLQVCSNKEVKTDHIRNRDRNIKNLQEENGALKIEIEQGKCVIENKIKELKEKNEEIETLQKKIKSSRPQSSYAKRTNSGTGFGAKVLNHLEVERLRLLELTTLTNKRLEEERDAHMKTQNLLKYERQRGAKMEANMARLELNSSRSSYKSSVQMSNPIEIESIKDQLELAQENVKALTTRLEIETYERKQDLQEFANILRNYECNMK